MKIVGYVRVSTTAQDLLRQKELIKSFCNSNNYTLSAILEDDGISGTVNDRQGYKELLSLTKNDADMVVVSELSRISRSEDFIDTITNIYGLLGKGIDLILLDEPNHIYSAQDRLDFMQFMGIAFRAYGAAEERKKICERTKTGKITKLANNPLSVCPPHAPLGFSNINGILTPNEEQIPIVQEIFKMIADGMSLSKTANYIKYSGYNIAPNTVQSIVYNTIYIGKRKIKDRVYEIPYKLIPEELFYKAQQTLQDKKKKKSNCIVHFNPLKGIFKCGCGASMYLDTAYGKRFYKCYHKKVHRDCTNPGVNAEIVKDAIWKVVSENINRPTDVKKYTAVLKECQKIIKAEQTANKKKQQKMTEITKLFKSKANLDDLLKGLIDEKILQLQKEIKTIEEEIKQLQSVYINKKAEAATYITKYNTDNIDDHGKAKIYNEVIDKIILDKGKLTINFLNGNTVILLRKNNAFIGQ